MAEEILQGLVSGEEIRDVLKDRSKEYYKLSVKKGAEKPYLEEGWEIYKELKTVTQLRKRKPLGELFEDEVWCTLAKMGFEEMSGDRNFKIPMSKDPTVNPKQIDIFVKERNVAIVVECKASEVPTKKSFRKEINEIVGMRPEIVKNIRKHYGEKLEVKWILALKDIILNDSDRALAKSSNIHILRDVEIGYLEQLTKELGEISKYQFLAEIFENKKISKTDLKVPAIRGRMGNNKFYSFLIEPYKILPLAFVSHRNRTDTKTIHMYQRMIKKSRLKSIREYVEKKGSFPNSIIVNFKTTKELRFEPIRNSNDGESTLGILYLPQRYKFAWIIDGQHRLYGFAGTSYEKTATLPIIAFENLNPEDQTKLFIDINSKQKKVSGNYLLDVQADLLRYSPDASERLSALISKLVLELNSDPESPLYRRIASPGQSRNEQRPITIMGLAIPIKDTRIIGYAKKGSNDIIPGPLYGENFDKTFERAKKVIMSYFNEFKKELPEHWETGSGYGGYLCMNIGLGPLIRVLKEILEDIKKNSNIDIFDMPTKELIEAIIPYTKPITDFFKTADYETIAALRKKVGGTGMRDAAYVMMEVIHNSIPDFEPRGLREWMEQNDIKWTRRARNIMPEIQLRISTHVLKLLKTTYGEEDDKWWYEGVPERVRKEVVQRRESDPEHKKKEQYFVLMDYMRIIANPKNWNTFKKYYAFKEYGNSKEKQLSWFSKLNKIRNRISHPERGNVSKDELEFLEKINNTLKQRIEEEK